jgi:hypothetical protein
MEYLLKQKRAKVEAEAERLFGEDILLKTVYLMTEMDSPPEEQKEVTEYLRKEAEDLAAEIERKMIYTYDASGNVILIKEDMMEIKMSD